VTSLSAVRATAAVLPAHLRPHWRIENELHYVQDVALKEEPARSGPVRGRPQELAAPRNTVVHMLSRVGAATLVPSRRLNIENSASACHRCPYRP
jgi:hypothetical protein